MGQSHPNSGSGAPARFKQGAPDHRKVDRGRTYKQIGNGLVEVYDLDTAAWLLMKGVAVSEAKKVNRRETVVTFYDDKDQIPKLVIDFLNSEANTFANSIRSLKKACWSAERR